MLSRSDGDISNKSQETRFRVRDYKITMKKVGDNQDDHLVGVQDKAGMRGDLIVGRRRSDGPATMEERARKQRSGENALCGKLISLYSQGGGAIKERRPPEPREMCLKTDALQL